MISEGDEWSLCSLPNKTIICINLDGVESELPACAFIFLLLLSYVVPFIAGNYLLKHFSASFTPWMEWAFILVVTANCIFPTSPASAPLQRAEMGDNGLCSLTLLG